MLVGLSEFEDVYVRTLFPDVLSNEFNDELKVISLTDEGVNFLDDSNKLSNWDSMDFFKDNFFWCGLGSTTRFTSCWLNKEKRTF